MLKKITFKRIALSFLLLLIAIILYHYPEELNQNVNDVLAPKIPIYLIDGNNFVSKSTIDDTSSEIHERIKLIIDRLTIGNGDDGDFKPVIPKGTKIISMDLNEGLLKINFSEEFYNVSKDNEEKMIEAIIYSLTELEEVDKIMIFVNEERLMVLPHSKKRLDLYLDRSYGINKVIDITDVKNTQMTTIYYLAKNDDYYYVPISFVSNNDDKINIIIDSLKTNTLNNSNLLSHLNYQVELMNYEYNNQDISLNFNNALLDSVRDGVLKEEVKYAIAYSLRDSMGITSVTFLVEGDFVDECVLT